MNNNSEPLIIRRVRLDFDENHPPQGPLSAASVTAIYRYGVWILVEADLRMKCASFSRYPELQNAPAASLFNCNLVDGKFVWPDLAIEIPFEEIEYP